MIALIQRVSTASVAVDSQLVGQIACGFLVLLGVYANDTAQDVAYLSKKITDLRVFSDDDGKMNLSLKDISGDILLISQFTLCADTQKGNRPSFIRAARPEQAIPLYELMINHLEDKLGKKIQTGIFGADMKVSLCNDGPVTIILDSEKKNV